MIQYPQYIIRIAAVANILTIYDMFFFIINELPSSLSMTKWQNSSLQINDIEERERYQIDQ